MFKKAVALCLSLILTHFSVANAQIDKCAFMTAKQNRIQEMRDALAAMRELQDERSRAREIRDLLVDTNDSREIALLAEALANEADAYQAESRSNRNIAIGSGLGATILAGLMIKRMKSSAQGANIMARLMNAIKSSNKKAIGKILTSTFVISVAASVWFGIRMNDISDKRKFLISLIAKLDALKDLSDQIVALSEELEQEEISFALRIDELQSQGVLEYTNGTIKCL